MPSSGSFPQPDAARGLLPIFLWRFLIASAAFCVLWQTSNYCDALIERRQRSVVTREAIRRGADQFTATLGFYTADLDILAHGQSLHRLVAGEKAALAGVERDFVTFVAAKPLARQLRYLDHAGNEVVRVDRRDGVIVTLRPPDLQNKSDRYYFKQSSGLSAGQTYVSPIDLNIEHGQIDVPWKPTLRLATPLFDAVGGAAGIVIVNISAADLIANVAREAPLGSAPIQLLNENGYWLAGVPAANLWGFMFGHVDATLGHGAPELWQRITADANGEFDGDGDHYIFRSVQPAGYVSQAGASPTVVPSPIRWTLVGIVPHLTIGALWERESAATAGVGVLLLALFCYGWSRTALSRREAEARKRAAESQLVRVERLASLGGLVAGVAHELNTPIGNAVTLASTLASQVDEFGAAVGAGQVRRITLDAFMVDMKEGTTIILRGLQRASELIGHFKQVAVDQTSEHSRAFRLAELVKDVVSSLQPQFRHCPVELASSVESTSVLQGYPGPLGQVLINLVENARVHAFDASQEGRIVISARDLAGGAVEVVVSDTGKGIAVELFDRIFEPFFTTRLGEGGSGLGLSVVFNIVTDVLGGTIRVESELGRGTAMIIRLPLLAAARSSVQLGSVFDVDSRKRA